MSRGHEHDPFYSLYIRNMVFHCIHLISREKGDNHYIQTLHNVLFCHYNIILEKREEKMP